VFFHNFYQISLPTMSPVWVSVWRFSGVIFSSILSNALSFLIFITSFSIQISTSLSTVNFNFSTMCLGSLKPRLFPHLEIFVRMEDLNKYHFFCTHYTMDIHCLSRFFWLV
jgi:hypothetical protein